MKAFQMGAAARPPVSRLPMLLLSSYPTQAPATSSGVKPMNQASR